MKNIKLLKNLTFYFFLFQVLGIFLSIAVLMFTLFETGTTTALLDINGRTVDSTNIIGKALIIIACIGYIIFTYAIFLFGYTIELFSQKIIFDDRIIGNFNKMGKAFLLAILFTTTPQFFPQIAVIKKTSNPEMMMADFDSLLFKIALALFFIILSKVFKTAKELKEENDLTV